jgi:Zn-finger nucleic acid-binding protein
VDLLMTDRQGVEIDYCPNCRGVWPDRGELDKIIERGMAPTTRRFDDDVDDRRRYESDSEYYKRRRKKSFLGELFDFD